MSNTANTEYELRIVYVNYAMSESIGSESTTSSAAFLVLLVNGALSKSIQIAKINGIDAEGIDICERRCEHWNMAPFSSADVWDVLYTGTSLKKSMSDVKVSP